MEELLFELQKKPFSKRFPNKRLSTNRHLYQLYQENIDQVWPSNAKNCKETLYFWAKKSGRKNVDRKNAKPTPCKNEASFKITCS